jgi:hypothetical protein
LDVAVIAVLALFLSVITLVFLVAIGLLVLAGSDDAGRRY